MSYLKWFYLGEGEVTKRKPIIWNSDSEFQNFAMKLKFLFFTLCNGEYYNRCDASESYQDRLKTFFTLSMLYVNIVKPLQFYN